MRTAAFRSSDAPQQLSIFSLNFFRLALTAANNSVRADDNAWDKSVSFGRDASRGSEMDHSKQHKKKYDAEGNAKKPEYNGHVNSPF